MSSIQVQSAEKNDSIILPRINHRNIGRLDMCEPYAQQYFQASIYYDNNNAEQRDDLLRSLAQNPDMLNDFYQFLEFPETRSAQQPLNQVQQQIPSILNIRTDFQQGSSTPKCSRPLNESGGSISSAPKLHKPGASIDTRKEQAK